MLEIFLDETVNAPVSWLILFGLAGIVVWCLIGPMRSNLRLVVQIMFFTAMTAVLVFERIPLGQLGTPRFEDVHAVAIVLAQLLWWLHLSWAVIGFVRIYLVLEGRPREARLLQDIVVGAVYMCVALSALAFVFGVPVGTLIATSGVIAIALGLALQNTLGDVFSGIALNLGHAYALGDWIMLEDGTEGRVVASTWRSTQILTGTNDIAVLPNNLLAKSKVTNVSRPDETHLLRMIVKVMPTHAPSVIEHGMLEVLASCNWIMREPAPLVVLSSIDASALEIQLLFRVINPAYRTKAQNEVIDRFYRYCRSVGFRLAMPASAAPPIGQSEEEDTKAPSATLSGIIEETEIFSTLAPSEKDLLVQSATERDYQKGEVIAIQEQTPYFVMIIRTGIVSMRQKGEEARRFSAGDILAEINSVARVHEIQTLEALTKVKAYQIDQEALSRLIADRPGIAGELAGTLSAFPQDTDRHASTKHERSASAFVEGIRTIFSS